MKTLTGRKFTTSMYCLEATEQWRTGWADKFMDNITLAGSFQMIGAMMTGWQTIYGKKIVFSGGATDGR